MVVVVAEKEDGGEMKEVDDLGSMSDYELGELLAAMYGHQPN